MIYDIVAIALMGGGGGGGGQSWQVLITAQGIAAGSHNSQGSCGSSAGSPRGVMIETLQKIYDYEKLVYKNIPKQ